MTISSANKTRKEYAEKPFSLKYMIGTQFTIEENMSTDDKPRSSKKQGISKKTNRPYDMDCARINISDGIFEKDLELTEPEWNDLVISLPKGLVNLKGVMIKVNRNGFDYKLEYVGIARADMNGNPYNQKPQQPVPTPEPTPKSMSDLGSQLSQAIELNAKMGFKTDRSTLEKIADALIPGKGLDLIVAAKLEGWIHEEKDFWRGV